MEPEAEDVAALLLARLDDVERLVLAASPGPWSPGPEHEDVHAADGIVVCDGFALSSRQVRATVDHIVAFDPVASLGLVAAGREVVRVWGERHAEAARARGGLAAVARAGERAAQAAMRAVAAGWGVDADAPAGRAER